MTGIFRIIVFFILFWLGYKYVRYLVQSLSGSGRNRGSFNKNPQKPEVNYDPRSDQQEFDGGEYIEYEEVKD